MLAAEQVKQDIVRKWHDSRVAAWVIDNIPLLHRVNFPEVPIFTLALRSGLTQINDFPFRFPDLRRTPKLAISGGLEGSAGQILALKEMHDIRALTSSWEDSAIVVMLEPTRYIKEQKHRSQIANLRQRTMLWAHSGLCDAVIILPQRRSKDASRHYQRIHERIMPVAWCSNPENPHAFEIVHRGVSGAIDWIRLMKHEPELHSSFLASTRNMTVSETRRALRQYTRQLVSRPDYYSLSPLASKRELTQRYFEIYSLGL